MIRILHLPDLETILNFERGRQTSTSHDELEREMAEWHAPWRREALEYYLNLGWSFGDFDGDKLSGYFLAQPFLFFKGMTQSLWIEHLQSNSTAVKATLLDVAYRTCREKHFQKLILRESDIEGIEESALRVERAEDKLVEIKTAKF